MKKAFTLIEVNLAMLVMAGGILSIVGLYAFGFRENNQSREDVASAAVAEMVINPLVMALSHTNNNWSTFNVGSSSSGQTYPANGWKAYLDGNYHVSSDPTPTAKSAFGSAMGMASASEGKAGFPSIDSRMAVALLVHHDKESATVSIALRAVEKAKSRLLMSQPIYYTEVKFQGVDQ